MNEPPRHTSGAKPMACSAPSTRPQRSAKWSRRESACAGSVTSKATTSMPSPSLRAVRWVSLMPRPAPVRVISAPSDSANSAAPKASDASVSTPVITIRLPSSRPTSRNGTVTT